MKRGALLRGIAYVTLVFGSVACATEHGPRGEAEAASVRVMDAPGGVGSQQTPPSRAATAPASGSSAAGAAGASAEHGGASGGNRAGNGSGKPTAVPDDLWRPPADTPTATGSYVYLSSDMGDYVGGGQMYVYDRTNAMLGVVVTGAQLSVDVRGDETWGGNFAGAPSVGSLAAGYYGDLGDFQFGDPPDSGLSWSGESRICGALTGWFAIDQITVDAGRLTSVDMRFEQRCKVGGVQPHGMPALHGLVHWVATDDTGTPGPVEPPKGLWMPPAGATPSGRSYVYLASEADDPIGGGATYVYTRANARLTFAQDAGVLDVEVEGDENWTGDFAAMSGVSMLTAGYYGDLRRYPFHNPVKGGLSWDGRGLGCNELSGWFVVDEATYQGTELQGLTLRFEQRCDDAPAVLHGQLHWLARDTTQPSGPITPVPDGLWEPIAREAPTDANHIYLDSDAGDYVGEGKHYTYTQANALLGVAFAEGLLEVNVTGNQAWGGQFAAMDGVQLSEGYYSDLSRYPFNNPVKGGLDWGGDGRGCNGLSGWFAIDHLAFTGSSLSEIDLRFEQHCEGADAALRGLVHWTSNDTTAPPGPVTPPPDSLWQPASGATPVGGNYIYLESDAGDFIGGGQPVTVPDGAFTVEATGSHLSVETNNSNYWSGDFEAMSSITQLMPGYYGGLRRYPFHNPVRGGLDWSGRGLGCNTLTGWFVIDRLEYQNTVLTAVDLRFEQHCEDSAPALHGQIHYAKL